jgi:hypothetical protein
VEFIHEADFVEIGTGWLGDQRTSRDVRLMSELRGIADIGLPPIIFHYRNQFSLSLARQAGRRRCWSAASLLERRRCDSGTTLLWPHACGAQKAQPRKSIGPVIKFNERTQTARSHSRLCRFRTVGDRHAMSVMCQFRTFAGALGDAIVRDYQSLDVAGTCLCHQLCATVTSAWDSSCPPGKICCSTAAP